MSATDDPRQQLVDAISDAFQRIAEAFREKPTQDDYVLAGPNKEGD